MRHCVCITNAESEALARREVVSSHTLRGETLSVGHGRERRAEKAGVFEALLPERWLSAYRVALPGTLEALGKHQSSRWRPPPAQRHPSVAGASEEHRIRSQVRLGGAQAELCPRGVALSVRRGGRRRDGPRGRGSTGWTGAGARPQCGRTRHSALCLPGSPAHVRPGPREWPERGTGPLGEYRDF